MTVVYWVEDEIGLLKGTYNKFIAAECEVVEFEFVDAVIEEIDQIRSRPGPIILDLRLPKDDHMMIDDCDDDPSRRGLVLLQYLQEQLGIQWPIFILSGNLSIDIINELWEKFEIPDDRIFPKPLIRRDELVEAVVREAMRLGSAQEPRDA